MYTVHTLQCICSFIAGKGFLQTPDLAICEGNKITYTVYSIVPTYTHDPRNVVNTCQYRQEALDESRGTCTNNIAVNIYIPNGKGFAIPTMLNYSTRYVLCCMVLYGWIDTSDISNFSYFN